MTISGNDTRDLTTYGYACAASGVLMAVLALLITAFEDDTVPDGQWSHPQSPATLMVISVLLAVGHALSSAGYWGARLADTAPTRAGRVGLTVATVGSLALSLCELASGLIGGEQTDSTVGVVVSTAFGVTTLVLAVAAIVAGVVTLRAGRTALGVLVLATGVLIIVLVTPANISGDLTFRQLSLLVWSLLYVPLGVLVARLPLRDAVSGRSPAPRR